MSNHHILKIHPKPLADLLSGAKTCEVRLNDRGFEVGDTVALQEINPQTEELIGEAGYVRVITHIQRGYGLPEHLCVLSYGQPAAGEPAACATIMLKRSLGGPSVGVVRFDADQLPDGALVDVYAAPPADAHGDDAPGTVRVTTDWLKEVHRDLDACQKVIWLAGCRPRVPGGFDPAYCEDAQARLKEIDEHIARAQSDGEVQ